MSPLVRVTTASRAAVLLREPTRLVMTAIGLSRLRRAHPEMFDGAKARAAVELAITEALAGS